MDSVTVAGATSPEVVDFSLLALFLSADWVVKTVMIGLLAASVWCWAIIVDKTLRPKLVGGPIKLPFLPTFFGLIGGVKTMGFLGIFIGPVARQKNEIGITTAPLRMTHQGASTT